jgi:Polyketide cyclase / dehydrase and lipid transport
VTTPTYADFIVIARQRDVLFDLVSDVTRMGDWRPGCKTCWWDEGDGPHVGAWFTCRNESLEQLGNTRSQWEHRAQVTVANRGREFAFVIGGSWIRWSYRFADALGGTGVTETCTCLPPGIRRFHDRFGDDADERIAQRGGAAYLGMAETLASIKRVAEGE